MQALRPMLALLALLPALTGCIDVPYGASGALSAPLPIAGELIVHDAARKLAWQVRDDAGTAKVVRRDLDVQMTQPYPAPDGSAIVFLDRSRDAVVRVGKAADAIVTAELGAPFSALSVCDDGKAALAFHADGAAATTLVNTAEVALVDLEALGAVEAKAPRRGSVAGLSRAPFGAGCTGAIALKGGDHRLVWVLSRSAIGLLDLGPEGGSSVVVPLASPESKLAVLPLRAVAKVEAGDVDLYVIAEGSNDVLRLRVAVGGAAPVVSLDQIGVGAGPRAMEVFASSAGVRVATLDVDARSVSVVNPATGASVAAPLDDYADTWVTFDGADGLRRAVAYSSFGGLSAIAFIELDKVEKKKGKAVTRLLADSAVSAVEPAGALLMLRHGKQSAVSLLDPATGKITAFKGTGAIVGTLVRGGALTILGAVGAGARLSRVDLDDLHGEALELPLAAQALLPYGEQGVAVAFSGMAGPALALWPLGSAAVADAKGKATPAKVHWLEGYTLDGVLDGALDGKKATPAKEGE